MTEEEKMSKFMFKILPPVPLKGKAVRRIRMIGKISSVKLGASSGDCETLTNVKRVLWEPIPREYRPQNVMNTVPPLGFHMPHKHVRGELHVLSEAYHAFYHNGTGNVAYIKPGADNVEIPYFVVTQIDEAGNN